MKKLIKIAKRLTTSPVSYDTYKELGGIVEIISGDKPELLSKRQFYVSMVIQNFKPCNFFHIIRMGVMYNV